MPKGIEVTSLYKELNGLPFRDILSPEVFSRVKALSDTYVWLDHNFYVKLHEKGITLSRSPDQRDELCTIWFDGHDLRFMDEHATRFLEATNITSSKYWDAKSSVKIPEIKQYLSKLAEVKEVPIEEPVSKSNGNRWSQENPYIRLSIDGYKSQGRELPPNIPPDHPDHLDNPRLRLNSQGPFSRDRDLPELPQYRMPEGPPTPKAPPTPEYDPYDVYRNLQFNSHESPVSEGLFFPDENYPSSRKHPYPLPPHVNDGELQKPDSPENSRVEPSVSQVHFSNRPRPQSSSLLPVHSGGVSPDNLQKLYPPPEFSIRSEGTSNQKQPYPEERGPNK